MQYGSWRCHKCRKRQRVALGTNKQKIQCSNSDCEAVYAVTGHHVNGTPFLRYMWGTSKLDRRQGKLKREGK